MLYIVKPSTVQGKLVLFLNPTFAYHRYQFSKRCAAREGVSQGPLGVGGLTGKG